MYIYIYTCLYKYLYVYVSIYICIPVYTHGSAQRGESGNDSGHQVGQLWHHDHRTSRCRVNMPHIRQSGPLLLRVHVQGGWVWKSDVHLDKRRE